MAGLRTLSRTRTALSVVASAPALTQLSLSVAQQEQRHHLHRARCLAASLRDHPLLARLQPAKPGLAFAGCWGSSRPPAQRQGRSQPRARLLLAAAVQGCRMRKTSAPWWPLPRSRFHGLRHTNPRRRARIVLRRFLPVLCHLEDHSHRAPPKPLQHRSCCRECAWWMTFAGCVYHLSFTRSLRAPQIRRLLSAPSLRAAFYTRWRSPATCFTSACRARTVTLPRHRTPADEAL